MRSGARQDAVACFRDAARLAPDAPGVQLNLANGLFAVGAHADAIAAYRRVIALDSDPLAALIAGQNRRPNRLWPAVAAGSVGCLRRRQAFDLALVNIQPRLVAADLPALAVRLRPGGDAIFSGLLESEREGYEERLRGLGFEPRERRQSGEWAALSARRT